MVEIVGCFKIPEKAVIPTNWVAVISVIVGLATAILAQTAAQHLHTNSVYFFAPGMGVAGLGVLAIILVNCCRKEPQPEAPKKKAGAQSTQPEKLGPAAPAAPAAPTPPPPPPLADDAPKFFNPMTTVNDYKMLNSYAGEQTGQDERAKENQPLAPPIEMTAVKRHLKAKTPDREAKIEAQFAALGKQYAYQVVLGNGNCFYFALLSGLLHDKVANERDLVAQFRTFATEAEIDVEPIIEIIAKVEDRETLFALISNEDKMKPLIAFLRQIAYHHLPESPLLDDKAKAEILEDYNYTDIYHEATTMAQLFGADLFVSADHPQYAQAANDNTAFDSATGQMRPAPHTPSFGIIFHNNHFNGLLSLGMLAKIGVPGAVSADAPQRS